jgi:hypothetical protein
MLGLIGSALWFGYKARQNGRSEVGWGLLGVVCYIVFNAIARIVAVSMTIRTESDATAMAVVINVFVYGALILIPFAITPKEEPIAAAPVTIEKREPASGSDTAPQDVKHEDAAQAPVH